MCEAPEVFQVLWFGVLYNRSYLIRVGSKPVSVHEDSVVLNLRSTLHALFPVDREACFLYPCQYAF